MFILSSAEGPKIYLFTSHEIRVILTPNDEKTTYANKTFEQVDVDISTSHLAVQSRSSTSINFNVIDLSQGLDLSSISFSYARLSATTTNNKMRIDNETDQSVTIINVQEGENTPISTTLIDKISIPFTDPQFAISILTESKQKQQTLYLYLWIATTEFKCSASTCLPVQSMARHPVNLLTTSSTQLAEATQDWQSHTNGITGSSVLQTI